MEMRRTFYCTVTILAALAPAGCSDEEGAPGREEIDDVLALPCQDGLDSVYEDVAPPSPWSADERGKIVRCAYDHYVSPEDMEAELIANGKTSPGFEVGAHKLRILYFTERRGEPVANSGIVYIPSERIGDPTPAVVLGHGSVGLGDDCAPSKEHPDGFEADWKSLAYLYAGARFLSIMPDFPGLGTAGAHPWLYAEDEAHAMLDGTRAIRDLMNPGVVSNQNLIVGHSNGGHAVLAASAAAEDYGYAGEITEIITINPIWLSMGSFGTLVSNLGVALLTPTLMANTMMYFYGHAEVIDGPGAGRALWLPGEKGDAAEDVIGNACWRVATGVETGPPALGIELGSDIFLPEYVDDVGAACGFNDQCDTPLSTKWREIWVADRPPPNTNIPILHWIGAKDDFILPAYQQCGIDRIVAQGGPQTTCVDPDGNHSGILQTNAAWFRQHAAAITVGGDEPSACAGTEVFEEPLECGLPLPNSTDPADP